ncbi:MAG TPA: helix-turn-helix transcriptional regulator [Solirubrobacterales bacterium]|nr:helix-turn-helix transcriptional regulator [Solirubrobacterales bacterium]
MQTGLVDALVKAAHEARTDKDISKELVADRLGKSVDTVRRFENGGGFPGLTEIMDAYSEATGVSLFDLLDAAKLHLRNKG